MRQATMFLATFETKILALLTISGAAYTDQLLISDQQTAQRGN
jgi:hypothetical protein